MSPVFCDTSGFYALVEPSNEQHDDAVAGWRRLTSDARRLVTTNYIVVETLAITQARVGLRLAHAFLDRIEEQIEIGWIDRAIHDAAVQELFIQNRRHLSFVDCTCFAFMRRHRIDTVFGFDPHFSDAGFTIYRA